MTAQKIPERVRWAVDALKLSPSDRVLEIGCGRGVAAALVCEQLKSGTFTGIDRSTKAIAAATERNNVHIKAGKGRFETIALENADFPDKSFDKIFAVNVNLFWVRSSIKELAALHRWLAVDGRLYLYWEPPRGRAQEITDKLVPIITANGFIATVQTAPTATSDMVCILGQPR